MLEKGEPRPPFQNNDVFSLSVNSSLTNLPNILSLISIIAPLGFHQTRLFSTPVFSMLQVYCPIPTLSPKRRKNIDSRQLPEARYVSKSSRPKGGNITIPPVLFVTNFVEN